MMRADDLHSTDRNMKRGHLYVVAAPSGTGKTSLVRALMQRMPELRFSISYTTRPQRETERHGHDYFFVDKPTFEQMIAAGEFLEHANVYGNFYGTSRSQVDAMLAAGDNVLLEIDWQGAQQIAKTMPERRAIFILPPSREALEQRLRGRNTDSDEVIARRLRASIEDLSHWSEFDYVVINDEFERAASELEAIVRGNGEHLRRDRAEVQTLIARLLA
jgi:guanylate kinase